MVVAFHAGLPVPGGFVGVDVFFVISGFVITAMLEREWSTHGRLRFGRFYARRFKRLTPALALTVTVTMLLTAVIVSPLGPQQNAALTAIGAMFMVANVVIVNTTGGYFSAAAETNPLLNVWSLSVEEQFYLAFPLLLLGGWLLARKRGKGARAPLVVVGIVAVVSFGMSMIDEGSLSFPGSNDALGFYSPVPRAWEFAVGALLALVIARARTGASSAAARMAPIMGMAGVIGLAASLFLIDDSIPFPGPWTLLPVISTLLVLAAGWQNRLNFVSRVLATAPMSKIGDWSYSIYLWHWPLIVLAATLWPDLPWVPLVAAAVAFVPAIASYRFVEEPLRSRSYSRRSFAVLVVCTLVPPLVAAGAVLIGVTNGYGNPTLQSYQIATRPHVGTACVESRKILAGATIECSFNTSADGAPIYLVGDSHADHMSDAVVEAALRADRPVSSRIAPACQLFDTYIASVGQEPVRHCREYFVDTMAWLTAADPGTVVISTAWRPFWDPAIRLGPTEQSMSTDEAEKLGFLGAGLTETIVELQAAGHAVVLVHDPPSLVGDFEYAPTECSLPLLVSRACDRILPLDDAEAQIAAVRDRIDTVATETGSQTVDIMTRICDADGCASRRGNMVMYADSNHVSAAAGLTFADEFVAVFANPR